MFYVFGCNLAICARRNDFASAPITNSKIKGMQIAVAIDEIIASGITEHVTEERPLMRTLR